jgi:hypothetical protein
MLSAIDRNHCPPSNGMPVRHHRNTQYHIGATVFGGMLPLLATAFVAATGNIYNGLWYPILVAVMTAVIGGLLLRDTKDIDIKVGSGVEAAHPA